MSIVHIDDMNFWTIYIIIRYIWKCTGKVGTYGDFRYYYRFVNIFLVRGIRSVVHVENTEALADEVDEGI